MKLLTKKQYDELIANQKQAPKTPLKTFAVKLSNGQKKEYRCDGWTINDRGIKLLLGDEVIAFYKEFQSVEKISEEAAVSS